MPEISDRERTSPVEPPFARSGSTACIAIDARKIADFGIGTSIQGLLAGLAAIETPEHFLVVLPPGAAAPGAGPRFRTAIARSRGYGLAEHLELPRIARRAGASLYHAPHYVLPLFLRGPAVVTIHDLIHLRRDYLPGRAARAYARCMIRRSYERATRVITVSEAVRAELLHTFGGEAERVVVVPNGIDERFFAPVGEPSLAQLRAQRALPAHFVVYAGNVKPHKNLERLIDAMAVLASRGESVDLVLAGAPREKCAPLLERAAQKGIGARVHALGWLAHHELRALFHTARAFVFPSLVEGFGLPPLEAMASGLPVVASNVPALLEVCGGAARHVDPLDVDSIAAGVSAVLTDERLRGDLSTRGIERARSFSRLDQARKTLAVWRDVLESAGRDRHRDVVYIGPNAWDHVDQRPHHLMRHLQGNRRILWVNPGLVQEVPRWLAEPLKFLRAPKSYAKSDRGRIRLLSGPRAHPRIKVLSVFVPLPFGGRFPLLHEVNTTVVALQIRAAIWKLGLRSPVLLAAHPKVASLAKRFPARPCFFDLSDDFAAFEGWHRAQLLARYESELARRSVACFGSSRALVDRLRAEGASEPRLLPNGVDPDLFSADVTPVEISTLFAGDPRSSPARADGTPRRTIGFVGSLAPWIDFEAIHAIARTRPEDRIVIVGPWQASVVRQIEVLEALPNVRVLGPVPHAEVPRWIRAFDVGLIPFRRSGLTDAVDPVKLYEYFACGIPVLSSAIREVSACGDLVHLFDSSEGIPDALRSLTEEWENAPLASQRSGERKRVARGRSWAQLAASLAGWIDGIQAAEQS